MKKPEIVLLRRDPETRERLERVLLKILLLDDPDHSIRYSKNGIELIGPLGGTPYDELSDGYRSTTQWALDFLGWAIYAESEKREKRTRMARMTRAAGGGSLRV